MPTYQTSTSCKIKVNNEELKHRIYEVKLKQYIDTHHVLKVKLRRDAAGDHKIEDPEPYTSFLGKPISVNIQPTGGDVDSSRALEFIGIVTEVDFENSIDAVNVMIITAKSPTISLDGARKNAFFVDITAGDVVGAILRNHPITLGTLDSTKGVMPFCVQYRETDYDFIMRLASDSGKFAFYDGREFRFVSASSNDEEELVWRETLGSFSMGLGTEAANYNAKVYNYEQDKIFSQDTSSLSSKTALSSLSSKSPNASKEIYSDSGYVASTEVVSDTQALDAVLNCEKMQAMGKMITCRGHSIVPAVVVGHCIKVSGMEQFNQQFWVKEITHFYDQSGKYHNTFVCTPVDIAYPDAAKVTHPITHLQRALVVDNIDPDALGRIQVKFPWNDAAQTVWIRYLSTHAGTDRGWYCLPEIDDEVLIGFEMGNPNYPIALGALYNKTNAPHSDTQADENNVKMFLTKGGNQIFLNDESDKEELRISMKDGKNAIIMKLSGPTISIISDGGDISLKGSNITLEGDGDITLKAGGNVEIKASGDMKAEAGGKQNLKGSMVVVEGNPINLN